jgi:glycosyltransferase involved in cell wall biosynthesis
MIRTDEHLSTFEEVGLQPAQDATMPVCKSLHTNRSILFLVDQLTELGGGERCLFQLARELRHHGYHVSVITFRGDLNPEAHDLFDNITILPLRSCFSLGALRVTWALRSFIKRERVTIVQTFFESSDTFGALVARLSGVAHIVSSRRDMGFLRSRKHQIVYRVLSPLYSSVIAVSEQVRKWHLTSDHLREEQICVIHNALDVESYIATENSNDVRRTYGLPLNGAIITTIANVNHWKGVDVFLEAAAIVLDDHPDAIFVIAGDWTDLALMASLRTQAHRLGIERSVHFLGRIADVRPLLFASDVFALLSRSEGFPNAVIEAMAAGLPVVATAVGGTPEAVEDSVTGFLVDNEDYRWAAACTSSILSSPSMRSALGVAGRRKVEDCFSLQRMIQKHLEVYDALFERTR